MALYLVLLLAGLVSGQEVCSSYKALVFPIANVSLGYGASRRGLSLDVGTPSTQLALDMSGYV
jgi:hypothetical protein